MVTRANYIREILEHEIISGVRVPGERLDEPQLTKQFNASRTPVREALVELATAGLIEMQPHRSAVVAEISIHQVIQLYEVLAELEGLSAKLAARRMTEEERCEFELLHRKIGQEIDNNNREAFPILNKKFHDMIHQGAHNEILESEIDSLNKRLAPYRRLFHNEQHNLKVPYGEHRSVVTAIRNRNEGEAAQIFKDHTALRADSITDFIAAFDQRFQKRSA
ncbi:MAG: GntR family transcriptional regulator [Pseudomonadota bacterium]|nr:GntR family transcriptional regulator [Pseudomonadota bacterium]